MICCKFVDTIMHFSPNVYAIFLGTARVIAISFALLGACVIFLGMPNAIAISFHIVRRLGDSGLGIFMLWPHVGAFSLLGVSSVCPSKEMGSKRKQRSLRS